MLLSALTRRTSPFLRSSEEMALAVYVLAYPICLFLTIDLFPSFERFPVRWQVLCVSALLSLAIVVLNPRSCQSYWNWLVASPFSKLIPLGLLWLLTMCFVHGFMGSQAEGLASGLFFLLLAPLSFYCWGSVANPFWRRLIGSSIIIGLLVENLCLSVHLYEQHSPNQLLLDGDNLPRLFLNTRHGNSLAVAAAVIAVLLLCRSYDYRCLPTCGQRFLLQRVTGVAGFSAVFFNALLTQGRGLFLSVAIAILAACSCCFLSRRQRVLLLVSALLSFLLGGLLYIGL